VRTDDALEADTPDEVVLLDVPFDAGGAVDGVREEAPVAARLTVRYVDDHRARVELGIIARVVQLRPDEEAFWNGVDLNAIDRITLGRTSSPRRARKNAGEARQKADPPKPHRRHPDLFSRPSTTAQASAQAILGPAAYTRYFEGFGFVR